MSFEEKSAWGSLLALTLVSGWYFPKAIAIVEASSSSAPLVAISVIWVIGMVIILAIYHGVIAMWGNDTDERDRLIELKADRVSGYVLSVSVLFIAGHIIANTFDPSTGSLQVLPIVVWLLLAMAFSEATRYITQIIYYRVDA